MMRKTARAHTHTHTSSDGSSKRKTMKPPISQQQQQQQRHSTLPMNVAMADDRYKRELQQPINPDSSLLFFSFSSNRPR
jgi:hypothetical protein